MTSDEGRFAGIGGVITSEAELREIVAAPTAAVLAKVTDQLDEICRDFIARSPFLLVATAHPDGAIDVSPKGDPAGFVRVLDERRLAIPDRPGNRRTDTFHNLLADPRVGLLFIVPGKSETLRVSGEARIVRDESLRASMAVDGKVPELAVVVYVERVFMHCPKCMIRGRLWQPESWPDSAGLPDIGEAMIAHAHLDTTPEELLAEAEREGLTTLY